jgi:hypothetical protein
MSVILTKHELQGSALDPPRFSLRALLLAMTALGCLFGLMSAVGGTWSLVLVFFLSLTLAHVLGNSVGTRLRDRASRLVAPLEKLGHSGTDLPCELANAEPARLAQRTRLNRITLIMSAGGALVGGASGGTRFNEVYPDSGLAAVALGVISSAVLGAFACFTASSFLSVGLQALGEATADCDPAFSRRESRGPH